MALDITFTLQDSDLEYFRDVMRKAQSGATNLDENEIKRFGLSAKINFAKSIVDLGQKRSLSSDYTKDYINDKNISGLENRLKLKLGISKNISDSTIKPFSSGSTLGET